VKRNYLVALALLSSAAGCKRAGTSDSMALVPKESTIIFSVNVDRLRGSKTWAQVKEYATDPNNKKDYDEFVQKTGLDPLTQITGLAGGFSGPTGTKPQFAVVIRGKFDEQRLVAYVKEKAKQDGKATELKTEPYGGKTVYGEGEDAGAAFLDPQTLVFGGRAWVHKVIDVAQGKSESVKKNADVQNLVPRAHTDHTIWAVGQVPAGEGQLPTGGEFKAVAVSLDLQQGLRLEADGQAPSPDQAKKMAGDLQSKVAESKTNPQVQMGLAMSGMGALVDSLKIEPDGAWVKMTASMTQQQLEELINRLKGLMQMFKGTMGGMAGPAGAPRAPLGAGDLDLPPPQPLAPPETPKRKKK
jgi:hypothetical protein